MNLSRAVIYENAASFPFFDMDSPATAPETSSGAVMGHKNVWQTGYSSSYGIAALVATLSLAAGLIAILTKGVVGKLLSLVAVFGVGLALIGNGHAGAAYPHWLTRPAIFIHVVSVAFWAGSLIPLWAAFAARSGDATIILRRFSNVIPFAVLPLIAAGMVLALIQLGSIETLWSTAYGQVLAVKLILLVPLFVLAAINRFWLSERAGRGDPNAFAWLRRSIQVEIALVLAVFVIAALWRFTPSPRALAETAAAPTMTLSRANAENAYLAVEPKRVGSASGSTTVEVQP